MEYWSFSVQINLDHFPFKIERKKMNLQEAQEKPEGRPGGGAPGPPFWFLPGLTL